MFLCGLGLSACAQFTTPLTRQDLLQQLAPMRNLETKYEELQSSASLALLLGVNPNPQVEKLTNHLDLVWLYYYTASRYWQGWKE